MNTVMPDRFNSGARVRRRSLLLAAAGVVGLEFLSGDSSRRRARPDRIHACGAHIVRHETYPETTTVTMTTEDFATQGPTTRLPHKVNRLIRPTVDEVNTVLHPSKKIASRSDHGLYMVDPASQLVEKKVYLTAHPDYEGGGILFGMYPGETYGARKLQRTTFHEGMHVLASQTDSDGNMAFFDSGVREYYDYAVQRKRGIDFASGRVSPDFRSYDVNPSRVPDIDQDGLFPLFDESAYDASEAGHPFDGLDELMASSLAVMRYFPNAVIASAETLCPDDRRVTAQYMGGLIARMQNVAADSQAFEAFFTPQLTDYVTSTGLR